MAMHKRKLKKDSKNKKKRLKEEAFILDDTDFARKYHIATDIDKASKTVQTVSDNNIERKIVLHEEIARICKFLKRKPPQGIRPNSAISTLIKHYLNLKQTKLNRNRLDAAFNKISDSYDYNPKRN